MITILLPEQLKKLADGKSAIEMNAGCIGDMIDELDSRYNGFNARLRKSDGTINPFVNIYVNGEDIRFLNDAHTALYDNDEISIVPAVAGG